MPVIAFSSPKGGAGKTTAATLVASELAERGASVTIIDADPNHNVADWAALAATPQTLSVVADVSEETIVEEIERAAETSMFVIIDLEGTASLMVSYAIAMADLVVIPVQGSQLDARQAARQIGLIKAQERVVKRAIPYAVLVTRTNPAINPKTLRFIEERLHEQAIPVLDTRLYDREAYRALFSFGGTLSRLDANGVGNLNAALTNARQLVAEIIERLRPRKPDTQDTRQLEEAV